MRWLTFKVARANIEWIKFKSPEVIGNLISDNLTTIQKTDTDAFNPIQDTDENKLLAQNDFEAVFSKCLKNQKSSNDILADTVIKEFARINNDIFKSMLTIALKAIKSLENGAKSYSISKSAATKPCHIPTLKKMAEVLEKVIEVKEAMKIVW